MSLQDTIFSAEYHTLLSTRHLPLADDIGDVYIIDSTLLSLYPKLNFDPDQTLLLRAGERTKSALSVKRIYNFLQRKGIRRSSRVVVIGGGTITDVAAFAVSTYKRGCHLILIPTTLLAMVDAAIGGKTAINMGHQKNCIGTFYPAAEVIIYPEFILSLPKIEFRNGLAEMLKLWFILPDLPAPPVKPEQLIQTDFIFQYALAKLQICQRDLTDKGERRLLNLGHTFAHALEMYSGFRIPHGRAVAWGLSEAALLSHRLKLIDDSALRDILSVIKAYGFARDLSIARDISFRMQLPELLRQDKKQTDEGYTLILFTGVRQVNVQTKVNLL